MSKRVVVTGMGIISPIGNSVDEYWNSLLTGKSGAGIISRFDVDNYSTQIACEVKDFDPTTFIDRKEARRMDLVEQFAISAAVQAVDDASFDMDKLDLDRCGVVIGSGIGGIETFQKQYLTLENSGPGRVSPFFIPMMIIDMCAGMVSMRFGFRGPNYATVSACASSSHAILDSMRIIERGDADVMITGGSEAPITSSALAGFCQAKALSTRNDDPEKASRPFDKDRDGFVMGEGAGIIVLESLEHAQARGAKIYAEAKGGGMTADAHHMTAPHPEGYGAKKAMVVAMSDAKLKETDISHVNTHGTSTGLGDIAEVKALKDILGDYAYKIPINSTKSMVGHLLGAAGAVEYIASVKSIENQKVHATINLDNPDPECDLDFVPHKPRDAALDNVMSNSFGFGGHNVSLIVGKYNGAK